MSSDPLVWQMETLRRGTQGWESQETLMETSARELGGASAGSLPPSVQGAATTFLTRWAGYARSPESCTSCCSPWLLQYGPELQQEPALGRRKARELNLVMTLMM